MIRLLWQTHCVPASSLIWSLFVYIPRTYKLTLFCFVFLCPAVLTVATLWSPGGREPRTRTENQGNFKSENVLRSRNQITFKTSLFFFTKFRKKCDTYFFYWSWKILKTLSPDARRHHQCKHLTFKISIFFISRSHQKLFFTQFQSLSCFTKSLDVPQEKTTNWTSLFLTLLLLLFLLFAPSAPAINHNDVCTRWYAEVNSSPLCFSHFAVSPLR